MAGRYDRMTQDDFDAILADLMDEGPASRLLSIPGVYEAVSEHFNNDVLDRWHDEHAAPPDPYNGPDLCDEHAFLPDNPDQPVYCVICGRSETDHRL